MALYKSSTQTAKNNAKVLRKNLTEAEQILWYRLRRKQLNVRFRRQVPIGKYIVDFYSADCQLVIELDGGQHTEQQAYDKERTDFLASKGVKVIRYWNNQVLTEIDNVVESILTHIADRII